MSDDDLTKKETDQFVKDFWNWTCPNCGLLGFPSTTNTLPLDEDSGIMICTECYLHPEQLNIESIITHLTGFGWSKENLDLTREAVSKYKGGISL